MKLKKEFVILGVIIAALTVYLFQRSGDRTRYTLPEVPALAASEITKIEITRTGQSVVLGRQGERWVIEPPGVAAAPKSVQEMLEALTGLTLTALVAESRNYSLYELDDEHKIHVRAWQDGRLRREFDIGKTAPSFRHTFVRLAGDDRVYHARDNFRFRFAGGPEDLRDKTVLSFKRPDITAVRITLSNAEAAFTRDQGAAPGAPTPEDAGLWKGPAGVAVNGARLNALLAALSDLTCEKFIPDRGKDSLGRPVFSITLTGGQEYSLSIFAPSGADAGDHPAVSSESDSPFVLSKEQAKTIMQDPSELLETGEKKEEQK
ncbi:MAG: DUF4340 domain-containing protein [Deltaproteobacteria bacterium]|nr:DUF4340 domain-containing protein [Deltaproteobacteria bacterium]